ncbi:hypothetical protein [Algoriphagus litoralis]|uniref:hypothetical protein n=1 Tax=Algoriphagus litoralis TaxID=2202829 RepID=UPI000DB90B8C|nr:hypothetical protein [Algoriphagus litoralis]
MEKLKFVLFAVMLLAATSSWSQTFEKGTKVASLGIGIGSSLGSFDYSTQVPGISLMYEQGIAQAGNVGVIGLGGYVGYKSFTYKTSAGSIDATSKWNYTIIGIRGALHFTGINVDHLDVYGGLMASYNLLNYSYSDNSGFNTGNTGNFGNTAGLTLFAGARYYFEENLGAFAELGYGVAYLNLGLSLKF